MLQIREEYETKIEEILGRMTLEEKIGQLNQLRGNFSTGLEDGRKINLESEVRASHVGTVLNLNKLEEKRRIQEIAVNDTRLGIPIVFAMDVIHGFQTIFPIPLAQASSWNLEAIERSERIAAIEASAAGYHWTFTPMVDVSREPRWGRVMEGAGEDPWLGAKVAEARVRGLQGDDLSKHDTILACAKHFAAYGAPEGGREYNTVSMSDTDLREVYLPPFEACVKAGVATFMCAFNLLNRVPASCNRYLMRQILRDEWGFQGFVVSDYNSIREVINHGAAADASEAARKCLQAGCDVDMMGRVYIDELQALVETGEVEEKLIDESVRTILRIKFNLGLFDDPYRYFNEERFKTTLLKKEHLDFSRVFATECMVLLKNDENFLPLKTDAGKSIALIGPLADTAKSSALYGAWSAWGREEDTVTIHQGLRAALPDTEIHLSHIDHFEEDITPEEMAQAVEAAKKADIAILALGEHGWMSGEGNSRADIGLPCNQLELVKAVHAVNPNVVCVIVAGRPLAIQWLEDNVPAVLMAWQPGTMAGHAIADILFGKANPSAKTTMTFPRMVGQAPIYYNQMNTGRPKPTEEATGPVSRWRDCYNAPLYPFGYGLSYTTFEYGPVSVSKEQTKVSEGLEVSCTVKNTGKRAGKEVVQFYIRDISASIARPLKDLKGFEKIHLEAGEEKEVRFAVTREALSFWNAESEYVFEPGFFDVGIGPDSSKVEMKRVEVLEG